MIEKHKSMDKTHKRSQTPDCGTYKPYDVAFKSFGKLADQMDTLKKNKEKPK